MVTHTKRLEVGLIKQDETNFEVLKEILNHQGIIYKEIDGSAENIAKFPCIIIIGKKGNVYEKAKNYCETDNNIIIADEIIPINTVLSSFTGVLNEPYLENKLKTPQIVKLEVEVVNKIRKCYYRLGLPFIQKWFWPNGAKACCIITHDIDTMNNSPPFGLNTDFMKYAIKKLFTKKAFNTNIDIILKEEKKRGFKSSFYFFTDYGKYQNDFLNNLRLIDEGFEIGLHAPLHTHYDPVALKKLKNQLSKISNREIVGIRQHGLYFSALHSWKYYDEIEFDYDATFSYNNKFGFRAGICYPYHPFNALNNKRFNVLEIPTSFMDWTGLLHNMDYNDIIDNLNQLMKNVERYNGCLVFIFHNAYLNSKTYPQITKLFTTTLDYIKEKKYWVCTAQECSAWWRGRENAIIDIKFKDGQISGQTSNSLPICIEEEGKKKKFKNINNTFQIQLN